MALWTLAPPQQSMVDDITWGSPASIPITETQTASSTSHEKGAWNEWVASTTAEWAGINLTLAAATSAAATDTSMLLDVGVGAAGSEVPIVENIPMGYLTAASELLVPIRVPAGVRVSSRLQAAVGSDTCLLKIAPVTGRDGFTGATYQSATTYGADTATSRGVTVTADTGTINTFGAWTVIAASTSAPIRAMILAVQGAADTDMGPASWRMEVGYGGSGVEAPVAAMSNTAGSGEAAWQTKYTQAPPALLLPTVGIPEGARLVARLMTSLSTTTTPSLDVVIIGLR